LTHRGRHTGRTYRTPIEVMVEDVERGEIIVVPAGGEKAGWYRNVVAGGMVEVRLRDRSHRAAWRRLAEDESRAALHRYRGAHPVFGRMIIAGLARRHHLTGEPLPAVAGAVPVLAFALTTLEPRPSTRGE